MELWEDAYLLLVRNKHLVHSTRKHMKKILLAIMASMLTIQVHADSGLSTDKEKLSYTIGIQIGSNLKQNGDIDIDALTQAIKDVFSGSDYKLTTKEMQEVMGRFQEKQFADKMEQSMDNKKAGEAFLAENKKKEGIVETDSGLQYKIIKEGEGNKPSASDNVEVHYHGMLIDGTVFDSSVDRGEPIVLGVGNVIKGWQEALPMMKEGSKWQVYIPSDLAYGERGAGGTIGPNSVLIFDIELLAIK